MTVFWLVAALFVLGALLMLLPPLWRDGRPRDPGRRATNLAVQRDHWREAERDLADGQITIEGFAQARAEIERRVHEDVVAADAGPVFAGRPARVAAVVIGLSLTLASVATYLALGRPEAASPQPARAAPAARESRPGLTPEQIQARVAALAERLKATPGDAEGWLMLGRSYAALGRYRDAAIAVRRAHELVPRDAGLLADLADILAMAQGKRLDGEPALLVQRALDLDPRHVKALALAGSVAFEARDYGAARGYWERLAAVLPPDSAMLASVRGSLAEAASLEEGQARASALGPAPAPGR